MPRWPRGLHLTAQAIPASGMRPPGVPRLPLEAYRYTVRGVPLQPGQAQGIIPASGNLNLTLGPQGIGTIWYPVQVTLTTTTGVLDTSLANIYLGPLITPATIVGTGLGNGVYALAIPPMTPGQYLIIAWTGGTTGDTAAANIIGTMDARAA
jgi:hypothetical protein